MKIFQVLYNVPSLFNYMLLGLTHQLSQPGVTIVTSILEKAKSSYLEPFMKLAQQIQVGQLLYHH